MAVLTLPDAERHTGQRAEPGAPTDAAAIRLATIYGAVGLSGNPFVSDPAFGPFVAVPPLAEAMATLLPWLERGTGPGLALVTGGHGSGRTRLMRHLSETLAFRTDLAVATVHTGDERWTDAQLLRTIIDALGGEPTGRTGLELTTEIRTRIDRNRTAGIDSVILIDDATFTGSQLEIVRTLLSSASAVSLVLFGPPELRERIARRRSLAGSLRHTVALGPMGRETIRTFIDRRIAPVRPQPANPEGGQLFTDEAVMTIADWSDGNPGAVVRIAGECVLEAIASSQTIVDRRVAHQVARELTDRARHEARLAEAAPFAEPAVQTRLLLDLDTDQRDARP